MAGERRTRGRQRGTASFPIASRRAESPDSYDVVLGEIKARIGQERLRAVLSANAAMIRMYGDIGRLILDRQAREGWGAKVIDRLSADLREAYPDMRGLSPRNLKYMRAFAVAWADATIVQGPIAQIPWAHNIALLERISDPETRLWYARKSVEHGWSHPILRIQIDTGHGVGPRRAGANMSDKPCSKPRATKLDDHVGPETRTSVCGRVPNDGGARLGRVGTPKVPPTAGAHTRRPQGAPS